MEALFLAVHVGESYCSGAFAMCLSPLFLMLGDK